MSGEKQKNIKLIGLILSGILIIILLRLIGTKTNPPPLVCTIFEYSNWTDCATNGTQNRTVTNALPEGCKDGNPIQSQKCTSPIVDQFPTCTTFNYSDWSDCAPDGTQSRTVTNALPFSCIGGDPKLTQECNIPKPKCSGPFIEECFNKIIQQIKNSPHSTIIATTNSETANVKFYYSVIPDPLDPKSKDALILETETLTYVDKNGQKYPNGPMKDYFLFRDTDFDAVPNYYWSSEFGSNMEEKPITRDTKDLNNLLKIWAMGFRYFNDNLLFN